MMLRCFLLVLVCFVSGCSSLPKDYPRTESFAYDSPETTATGRVFARAGAESPETSGLLLLTRGEDALQARNAMVGIAEKTLDVQYYIWEGDKSGRLLVQRLLEAADRGVRVRILLDDFTLSTKDIYLATFDAHPNVEIRLFNPFAQRLIKNIGFLTDMSRVNHRMHNKLFIADNVAAIVGGRNIADHYFGIDEQYNFRDLDVLTVGPVVKDISNSFDYFWNSQWAFPINAVYKRPISASELQEVRAGLEAIVAKDIEAIPFSIDIDKPAMYASLEKILPQFIWSRVRLLYDTPDKVQDESISIRAQANWLFHYMKDEFLAEVAYFVPGKQGIENFKTLVDRGVKVRVLTNSYASNDVAAAHAGYATYRKRLLKAGVELYEYKADATERSLWPPIAHGAESRLHTKTFVIDRKFVFIGSYNADPRSHLINTEIGLLVENAEFAEKVIGYLNAGVEAKNSYHIRFKADTQKLRWHSESNNQQLVYKKDPNTSWWQRFKARLIRMLPIEGQL